MSKEIIKVPDIGADSAEVIEILVAVGDSLEVDQSLAVLESDKASLEVPSPVAGTVTAISVALGDQLSEGMDLVEIDVQTDVETAEQSANEPVDETPVAGVVDDAPPAAEEVISAGPVDFFVPDMGSDSAEIIEIPVAVGDSIEEGDTIVVVETDKASVEVPAEASGEILELHVSEGGTIAQGDKLITLHAQSTAAAAPEQAAPAAATSSAPKTEPVASAAPPVTPSTASSAVQAAVSSAQVHAGPAVRKLARQLGVDLAVVKPTGQRGRILKEDVHAYVKQQLKAPTGGATSGSTIPEIPAVDWAQFGDVDVQPMSRIGKVTAANMSRNWLNVPHVTQFDNADVTDLEEYRAGLKPESIERGIKMTPLAFLLKASALALKENPKFNTALHQNGSDLVERKYFHISVAVDTPLGLMVPVIRDVDKKDIWELASDLSSLAGKAKEGKLSPKEMQGASFTISSLGAIGGTGFTPIVPAPQVGIMGVSKTSIQPVWDGNGFVPRKLMPLALSYDHRVVNGADAGKFMTCFAEVLADIERICKD